MKLPMIATFLFCALPIYQNEVLGQEASDHNHGHAAADHKSAVAEHKEWAVKIGKMKADHGKALAALSKLRAEILLHNAELDTISSDMLRHEMAIESHDSELQDHAKETAGGTADPMESSHQAMMRLHQSLGQRMEAESNHHDQLISSILELTKKHAEMFHSHHEPDTGHSGSRGKGSAKDADDHGH
jgi:Skp family chaperone for outer membrane proteins